MPPDADLLRQFADHGDEAAFAELVRRHADFVYSVALRVTCNGALAQDVTQAVFTTVARQAGKLRHYDTLLGWLHTTARHIAINTVRSEARRRVREQEATAMQNDSATPEMNWAEIGPLLDEAVGQLREQDRKAVLLRFFKNLSHQEVGAALGLGEDAARKRVDRALEKLREHFSRRGVTASSALLATAMVENSVQAAPVGLVAQVTATSLAGMGTVTTGGTFLLALVTFFMSTKTKTVLAAVVILAIVAALAVKWQNLNEAPVPNKVSEATKAKTLPMVTAALPKTSPTRVAAPVMPAAPVGSSLGLTSAEVVSGGTGALDDPFASPPNADLKTAIPSLAHYIEIDDFVHVIPFVMTPAEVQQALASGKAASLADIGNLVRVKFNNNLGGNIGGLVQMLKTIQGQTPTMDENNTKAVYKLDPSSPVLEEVTFLQKDGLWYLY